MMVCSLDKKPISGEYCAKICPIVSEWEDDKCRFNREEENDRM